MREHEINVYTVLWWFRLDQGRPRLEGRYQFFRASRPISLCVQLKTDGVEALGIIEDLRADLRIEEAREAAIDAELAEMAIAEKYSGAELISHHCRFKERNAQIWDDYYGKTGQPRLRGKKLGEKHGISAPRCHQIIDRMHRRARWLESARLKKLYPRNTSIYKNKIIYVNRLRKGWE